MQITNTEVYGIERSILASGLPMMGNVEKYQENIGFLAYPQIDGAGQDFKRATKLGNAQAGSGHDHFLCGIIVQADFTMPSYWWPEAQRYHWFDFVSSQSKMHRLADIWIQQEYQFPEAIRRIVNDRLADYQHDLCSFENVLEVVPMGLELTARMTTNYLQIKTMYSQRKDHKLRAWSQIFAQWVQYLPYAKELGITGGNNV